VREVQVLTVHVAAHEYLPDEIVFAAELGWPLVAHCGETFVPTSPLTVERSLATGNAVESPCPRCPLDDGERVR